MPITTVNSNQLISAAKYNEIQTAIAGVLTYYGVNPTSVQVSDASSIIYADNHWTKLYNDVTKCTIHQTGATISGGTTPASDVIASVLLTNKIIDAANLAVTNKDTVASGQTTTFNNSSTRTSNFGSNVAIHHTVEYEWVDANAMTYFLQSGGRLEADLSWVNAGLEFDSDLIAVLGLADTAIQTNTYKISNSNQTPSPYTISQGAHTITITFDRISAKKYTLDVSILSTLVQTLNGSSITGTFRYVASTDAGTVAGGILAPIPQATTTVTFQGSSEAATPTKALSASPTSLSYTFYTGDAASASQTITLTNNGNTAVSITGITFSNAGTVIANPIYSWTGNGTFANTTVSAGASRTIALTYSGATAGTHDNSVTIANNGNQPTLVVATKQIISGFSLSPASVTPTVTNLTPYTQQFVIQNSNVSPILSSSYTANLSGSAGFSVINSNSGPTVVFDPSGRSNGAYNTTLSVTLNGYTVTRTVNLTLSVPTQNIGSWLSATASDNAVMGVSYDIIGGTRYLTLGVGMGNDGAGLVNAGGGSFASATNLNYAADPDPSKGIPLYDYYQGDGAWNNFLKGNAETGGIGYGVSYLYHQTMQVTNNFVVRSYTFSANAGAHTYEYSIDDYGYVEISNPNTGGYDIMVDLRTSSGSNYRNINSGTWTAPATGTYTIRFNSRNTFAPGAIAFRLTNNSSSQVVWSTRVPVRVAYTYWAEVYRVPLTQGAHTYYSKEYIVKDSAITFGEGYPYGAFFEGQSLFSVTDDGSGNLTVTVNPIGAWPVYYTDQLTIANIKDLPYYFSDYSRYTNLSNGSLPAGQTYRFIGFQADGTVQTTTVAKPSADPITTFTTGGGSCPSPEMEILMHDGTTMKAGDIKVGMEVLTRHETTDELGVWPVTAVSMAEDERWIIKFDDGREFIGTFNHRMLTPDGWLEINKMSAGQTVIGSPNGDVVSAQPYDRGPVVKITVDQAHTYISQGLLSHNIKVIDNVDYTYNLA